MTSPVSIGDALLLAKIALRLGKTFTTGRKSAPSEFREVETQLFALSTALSALHGSGIQDRFRLSQGSTATPTSSPESEGDQDDGTVLGTMLEDCSVTLAHLEKVVEQYAVLKGGPDADHPTFKRWSKKLSANIKKIRWTTEGGDLATLRSYLMVHINSINVVIGVANK